MCEKKWLEELLRALDGHTAASLAEAENALSRGFKPFDVFIAEVRTLYPAVRGLRRAVL